MLYTAPLIHVNIPNNISNALEARPDPASYLCWHLPTALPEVCVLLPHKILCGVAGYMEAVGAKACVL